MAGSQISFDFTRSMSFHIQQRNGVSDDELNVLFLRAPTPRVLYAETFEEGKPAFLETLDPHYIDLDGIRAAWGQFSQGFPGELRDLLVLGIGGSALGTMTLQAALLHPYANLLPPAKRLAGDGARVHVVDNADPWQLEGILDVLAPESTGVFVASKSGNTAETLCAFGRVRDWLNAGGADWRRQTVVCTDSPRLARPTAEDDRPRPNPLLEFAESNSIICVGIPPEVGGRFSVFTAVSLFPALAMGLDVDALLDGARVMADRCREPQVMENPAFLAAAIQYTYFTRPPDRRRNIVVLMPYAYRLRLVADWFAQLWAESLGKRIALDGSKTTTGQTPVKALGATDQHSQLQLYQDGPQDKSIIFIKVKSFERPCPVPALEIRGVGHLGNRDLGELLNLEHRATEFSLAEARRPTMTIEMDSVCESSMGELLMFFMMMTAVAGELLNVNAYDQPGVEASKRATHALCGRGQSRDLETKARMEDECSGRRLVL